MRKQTIILLSLVLLLALFVSACGGGDEPAPEPTEAPAAAEPAAEEPAAEPTEAPAEEPAEPYRFPVQWAGLYRVKTRRLVRQ